MESGPDSYLENLDFAIMLAGEMRKGPWVVIGDLIYLDFSKSNARTVSVNLPGGSTVPVVDTGSESSLSGDLIMLAPGCTVYRTARAHADVFAGLRYLTVKPGVDWSISGPVGAFPATGTISEDVDVTDGIVGVRGRVYLQDPHWSVPYHLDIGTGDSDLSWQAMVGAAYSFSWGDVTLAYRHLEYDLGSNTLLDNLGFGGPALGATFRF